MFNPQIFKAYDVRGIYSDELDGETMEKIGRSFVQFLSAKKVVVGYDMRLSSPELSAAFMRGCVKQGADVLDLGQISTDALYFCSGKYDLPGVMITASHNPKEYNGVKFCRAGAEPIGGDSGLEQIKELVSADNFVDAETAGVIEKKENILKEFRDHCLKFIDKEKIKPLKIVVDAGNGMAGKVVPIIFENLPCEIIPLYFELDGNFPHHPSNPLEKENVLDLISKVKESGADLGLAFDGDADRVFFIDEKGERVDSSFATAMIAKNLLKKNPGEKVIYTVTVSKAVPDIVEKMGSESILTRVGHSFIKELMKKSGAIFSGEHSGHYYFRDNFRADSGIIAALIVIEMLSESGKKLSEFSEKFDSYHKIEEMNTQVEDKDLVIQNLKEKYGANLTQEFDGVTFEFPDWWFNVRPSNTEPLLRLNLEANSEELMEEKTAEVLGVMGVV
ncbi:phosphomannomutase/phosphoglucomutase [Patescibacteria group bacterium]|nr:phosphomannomutase/phosphoglucomutase [Patescibacteria group bacterium]